MLALLALRHGHVVTTGTLMEEIWGDHAPASALATLQTYIYQVRRLMIGADPAERRTLLTKPLGYLLELADGDLDRDVFEQLVAQGRTALESGEPDKAAEILAGALKLSSAAPLADVEAGPVLSAHLNQLAEAKLQAVELRMEAELQLGRHRELISELKSLTVEHPFHENFHAKLMMSLERCGRRSEALETYQQLRRTLIEELGIEPSAGLRGLQDALLHADEAPCPPQLTGALNLGTLGAFTRPAQLPPDIGDLVGRAAEIRRVRELATADRDGTAVRVVSLTGMTGVGKSVLAVRAAHQARAEFPDGQFHAELGGSGEDPADPFEVLGDFLRATGLPGEALPGTLAERSSLFRSWTAERKVLVLLDDAAAAGQVRPLLPGGAGCAVLVTSRTYLPGLAGAGIVEVDTLPLPDCLELLARLADRARIQAEPESARAIVQLCGQLPLAVRMVGAKLAARPRTPLCRVAARLADERRRLTELRFGELDLGARLTPSYRRLAGPARRVLQRLAQHNATIFIAAGVAALIGLDAPAVEVLLDQLADARFLQLADLDISGETGFVLPALVRSFVLGAAGAEDQPAALDTVA
ncbi:NB-ARC domain-containing protein [Crossiella sp. SN42]|nr:NB-ARC domain-containing protein [Crossiella sp. SN42]